MNKQAMNKELAAAIDRLGELTEERQQAAAAMILHFLEHDEEGDDPLTPEQWAEIERRLDEEDDEVATDEEVKAFFDSLKA
jgi:hypothetical protein